MKFSGGRLSYRPPKDLVVAAGDQEDLSPQLALVGFVQDEMY
jgi:hypothetical protein